MGNYKITVDGKQFDIKVLKFLDGSAEVEVNGTRYNVEIQKEADEAPTHSTPSPAAGKVSETAAVNAFEKVAAPAGAGSVNAPLPGVILKLMVAPGESVKRGQKLALLEAMKMENEIRSPKDGTVDKILVSEGDSVLEGQAILSIK